MRRLRVVLTVVCACIASSSAMAAPVNRAEIWNSWSSALRESYIDGYQAGLQRAAAETAIRLVGDRAFEDPRLTVLFKSYVFRPFELSQLASVVSSLYRDPANAYVSTGDMVLIARSKLAGDPIDEALAKVRKAAADWNAILDSQK